MKKGFTLIEIMVVIVIMGVLAAVGVPKLFAMIAKAKASEAPTAAGVYIHLQEAYQADKTVIGSWKNIGYEAPGTNGVSSYFKYKSCADEDIVYDGNQSAAIGWAVHGPLPYLSWPNGVLSTLQTSIPTNVPN